MRLPQGYGLLPQNRGDTTRGSTVHVEAKAWNNATSIEPDIIPKAGIITAYVLSPVELKLERWMGFASCAMKRYFVGDISSIIVRNDGRGFFILLGVIIWTIPVNHEVVKN